MASLEYPLFEDIRPFFVDGINFYTYMQAKTKKHTQYVLLPQKALEGYVINENSPSCLHQRSAGGWMCRCGRHPGTEQHGKGG